MAVRILGGMTVFAAIWFSGSGPARPLRGDECAQVSGGCEVTAFANCARATLTKVEECGKCVNKTDCTSSHVNEACTPLTNTAPEDCIACGTCDENCGGQIRNWSLVDCKGTFTNPDPPDCKRKWKDAQNGECDPPLTACPAE